MSDLSAKLAELKGGRTTREIIMAAECSRETFRRIERGDSVKLSTLKEIAKALKVAPDEWLGLATTWAKHELEAELGTEAHKVKIEISGIKPTQHPTLNQTEQVVRLFESLPHEQRVNIIKTMSRPEVIRMLPSIHALYDSLHPTPPQSKSQPRRK